MKYIFLHGLGQTASSWDKTISCIGEKENIICPNLFELLQKKEVTYANLYEAFSEYCKNFSEPFAICGLSLGGVLALHYSIENPDKVKAAVLIGTQYKIPKGLLKLQNIVFHIMPQRMFDTIGLAKKDAVNLSKSMMDLDFRQELQELKCPVLVIWGDKDKANKKASSELAGILPHAELKIIQNAGHEVNIDAPEKLGEVLKAFLIGLLEL